MAYSLFLTCRVAILRWIFLLIFFIQQITSHFLFSSISDIDGPNVNKECWIKQRTFLYFFNSTDSSTEPGLNKVNFEIRINSMRDALIMVWLLLSLKIGANHRSARFSIWALITLIFCSNFLGCWYFRSGPLPVTFIYCNILQYF